MQLLTIKSVVIVHWIFTIWGSLFNLSATPYVVSNITMLCVGVWAIAHTSSVDALFMFILLLLLTVLSDIILLCIFYPYNVILPSIRFGIATCIMNLILKPFSLLYLYQEYKERGGEYSSSADHQAELQLSRRVLSMNNCFSMISEPNCASEGYKNIPDAPATGAVARKETGCHSNHSTHCDGGSYQTSKSVCFQN